MYELISECNLNTAELQSNARITLPKKMFSSACSRILNWHYSIVFHGLNLNLLQKHIALITSHFGVYVNMLYVYTQPL